MVRVAVCLFFAFGSPVLPTAVERIGQVRSGSADCSSTGLRCQVVGLHGVEQTVVSVLVLHGEQRQVGPITEGLHLQSVLFGDSFCWGRTFRGGHRRYYNSQPASRGSALRGEGSLGQAWPARCDPRIPLRRSTTRLWPPGGPRRPDGEPYDFSTQTRLQPLARLSLPLRSGPESSPDSFISSWSFSRRVTLEGDQPRPSVLLARPARGEGGRGGSESPGGQLEDSSFLRGRAGCPDLEPRGEQRSLGGVRKCTDPSPLSGAFRGRGGGGRLTLQQSLSGVRAQPRPPWLTRPFWALQHPMTAAWICGGKRMTS